MKPIFHIHKKYRFIVKARRQAEYIIFQYEWPDYLRGRTERLRINDFFQQYEQMNLTRKCEDCNRYSGWKFYCKSCHDKRQKELNKIASDVLGSL